MIIPIIYYIYIYKSQTMCVFPFKKKSSRYFTKGAHLL